jgi:serine/threonine protein kinase
MKNIFIVYLIFLNGYHLYKFTDIKEIGEGGFSKVYSATWIDGISKYHKNNDGSWKKVSLKPMIKVALKG